MKTEKREPITKITTSHPLIPVDVQWCSEVLFTEQGITRILYNKDEAIQLRDFLIQLNLDKDEK